MYENNYMYGFNGKYGTGMNSYAGYQQRQQNPQARSGVNFVQGIIGAKAYMVEPGETAFLMDSENSCFYIKSADQAGMPLPLRVFDYTERSQEQIQNEPNLNDKYVTRDEFDKLLRKLETMRRKNQRPEPKQEPKPETVIVEEVEEEKDDESFI